MQDSKRLTPITPSIELSSCSAAFFRYTEHNLRHCFGSYLAMADVNEKARMELMGHKDPKMTMRHTHISDEYRREAVKQLEKIGSQVTVDFTTEQSRRKSKSPQSVVK